MRLEGHLVLFAENGKAYISIPLKGRLLTPKGNGGQGIAYCLAMKNKTTPKEIEKVVYFVNNYISVGRSDFLTEIKDGQEIMKELNYSKDGVLDLGDYSKSLWFGISNYTSQEQKVSIKSKDNELIHILKPSEIIIINEGKKTDLPIW